MPKTEVDMYEDSIKATNRFQAVEFIGQGGHAYAFKAYDTKRKENQNVTIKILKDKKRNIVKEGFNWKGMGIHEHIVTVYELFEYESKKDKEYWLIVEFVKAPESYKYSDLSKLIPIISRDIKKIQISIEIAIQICKALEHAHQNNIVHRDVKPGNILVTQKDNRFVAKLTDFGIALDINIEDEIAVIGTTAYMAPEQIQPHQVPNVQWDIYALAVVLYEMIEGTTPFNKTDTVDLINSIKKDNPRPFQMNIPRVLQKIIFKGLEKNPGKRYQTAMDMRIDLEIFQSLYSVKNSFDEIEQKLARTFPEERVYSLANELYIDLSVDTLVYLHKLNPLPENFFKHALLSGALEDYNKAEENIIKTQELNRETHEHILKINHPFIKRFVPSEIETEQLPNKDNLFLEILKGIEQKIQQGQIESARKAAKFLLELCNLPNNYLHLFKLFFDNHIFDFLITIWEQTNPYIFTFQFANKECLASLYRYVGLAYYFHSSQIMNKKTEYEVKAKKILEQSVEFNISEQDVYDILNVLSFKITN